MDYSQLPEDIVEKITAEHLPTLSQHIAFSGVCKSWRSSALHHRCSNRLSYPGLLIWKRTSSSWQSQLEAHSSGQNLEFWTLSSMLPCSSPTATTNNPPPPSPPPRVTLPLLPPTAKMSDALGQRRRYLRLLRKLAAAIESSNNEAFEEFTPHYLGSKDGWILRTLPLRSHRHRLDLYLIKPISGAVVPLPPLPLSFPSYEINIEKAIITSSPDDEEKKDDHDDCYIFILSRSKPHLIWCKVGPGGGGQGWDFLPPYHSFSSVYLEDATYFGCKLYILQHFSEYGDIRVSVMTVGPASTISIKTFRVSNSIIAAPPGESFKIKVFHLYELNGQLHVIIQSFCYDNTPDDSLTFQAYKLVVLLHDDEYYWEEVWSFSGHAVFIGHHQSFSIPAATLGGGRATYKADSIYCPWDCYSNNGGPISGYGVFHLPSQKLERFIVRDHDNNYHNDNRISTSFWFLPMSR